MIDCTKIQPRFGSGETDQHATLSFPHTKTRRWKIDQYDLNLKHRAGGKDKTLAEGKLYVKPFASPPVS